MPASASLIIVVATLLEGAAVTMIDNRREERKRNRQNVDGSIHRVTPGGDQEISHQMEPRDQRDDQHQRGVLEEQMIVTVETGDVVMGRRIRLFSRAVSGPVYRVYCCLLVPFLTKKANLTLRLEFTISLLLLFAGDF